jgi:cytoskeletal protein RodZ
MSAGGPDLLPLEGLGGTLGSLFRAAREALGIPIEEAAHRTRIRVARLREIEADDLSQLPPAYARMFLRDYARYLHLDEGLIEERLPEAGEFGIEGYQYIRNAPAVSPGGFVGSEPVGRQWGFRAVMLRVLVLGVVATGLWQGWVMWRKIEVIRSSELVAGDRASLGETREAPPPPPKTPSMPSEIEMFRAVGEEPAPIAPARDTGSPAGTTGAETAALVDGRGNRISAP